MNRLFWILIQVTLTDYSNYIDSEMRTIIRRKYSYDNGNFMDEL